MYHPAAMRRAGPILIVLIGVARPPHRLLPEPHGCPTASSATGHGARSRRSWASTCQGGLRVEYQALPKDGQSPTAASMAIIKDIIERRVNTTGVSEPVVVTQGTDRVVVELPGVTDPDVGAPARRPDRPPGLRPARPDAGDRGPGPRPRRQTRRCSAATRSRRPRSGSDQNGGLTVDFVAQGRGRQAASPTTPRQHIGEYFAITLDGTVISAPVINERDPRTARSRSRPAASAASRRRKPTSSSRS